MLQSRLDRAVRDGKHTASAEFGYAVATDAEGNAFTAGYTGGDLTGEGNAGSNDVVVVKHPK